MSLDSNIDLSAAVDALVIEAVTDDERGLATTAVLKIAARDRPDLTEKHDIEQHALPMLAALGLIDPLAPIPGLPDAVTHLTAGKHVKQSGATTHGTEAGYRWHVQRRSRLCSPCQAWGRDNQADTAHAIQKEA
jgi:hypothetical protein